MDNRKGYKVADPAFQYIQQANSASPIWSIEDLVAPSSFMALWSH